MLEDLEEKVSNAELLENDRRMIKNVIYNLEKLSEHLNKQGSREKKSRIKEFTEVVVRTTNILCDPGPDDFDICELYYNLDKHSAPKLMTIFGLSPNWPNYKECSQLKKDLFWNWCELRKRYPIKTLRLCAKNAMKEYLSIKEGGKDVMIE